MKGWAEGARFLGTGLLNTAFGYAVYALLVAIGTPYLAALALTTVAGILFNFVTYGRLTFRVALHGGDFPRFVLAYGAALAFNALLLWVLHGKLKLDPYTAQLACLPPTVALTYLVLKRWVYAPGRSHGH